MAPEALARVYARTGFPLEMSPPKTAARMIAALALDAAMPRAASRSITPTFSRAASTASNGTGSFSSAKPSRISGSIFTTRAK